MLIRPFAAIRPNVTDAALVASVPYDVAGVAEVRELAAGNPKSFLHVSRPEIDLPEGTRASSDEAYRQSRQAFDALLSDGTLVRDDEPGIYLYRLSVGGREQTGIVATFDTKEYLSGVIRRHETTRRDKEDDRTRHIENLGAQTGPAYLTYRDVPAVDALVARGKAAAPLYDFVAPDGVAHTVWKLSADETDEVVRLFAAVPTAYIADGHHRSAAAARVAAARAFAGEARFFMAVIFPASQLRILPYNRVVADLNGLSTYEFLSAVSENFTIGAKGERNCRMYVDGVWHDLSWTPDDGAVESLDVSYLQTNLLAPVLGIADPRTSRRIAFVGGIRGDGALAACVDAGSAAVAFAMEPVTVGEMMAIADSGAIMPPKSTWFEPKLRSGLFIHAVGAQ